MSKEKPACPRCGSFKCVKNGFNKYGQVYKCKKCGRAYTESTGNSVISKNNDILKDESSPNPPERFTDCFYYNVCLDEASRKRYGSRLSCKGCNSYKKIKLFNI